MTTNPLIISEAVFVLEDCLVAGDNPEKALSDVAADFNVDAQLLANAFQERFGQSYLSYIQ